MGKYKIIRNRRFRSVENGTHRVVMNDGPGEIIASLDVNKYGWSACLRSPLPIKGGDSIYFYGSGVTPEESIENAIRFSERMHTEALTALNVLAKRPGLVTEKQDKANLLDAYSCPKIHFMSPGCVGCSRFGDRKEE